MKMGIFVMQHLPFKFKARIWDLEQNGGEIKD